MNYKHLKYTPNTTKKCVHLPQSDFMVEGLFYVIVESLTTNCTLLSMEAHEWFYHCFLKYVVDLQLMMKISTM
jgi:hypothetical protein